MYRSANRRWRCRCPFVLSGTDTRTRRQSHYGHEDSTEKSGQRRHRSLNPQHYLVSHPVIAIVLSSVFSRLMVLPPKFPPAGIAAIGTVMAGCDGRATVGDAPSSHQCDGAYTYSRTRHHRTWVVRRSCDGPISRPSQFHQLSHVSPGRLPTKRLTCSRRLLGSG